MKVQARTASKLGRRRARIAAVTFLVIATALVTAALAAAEKPTIVRVGNLVLTLNGEVTPKALPKKTRAPVSLHVEGKIGTADGTHPPAVTEIIVDTDKDGTVDARGVPTCRQGQLEAQTTENAEAICGPAIIGTGTTDVELALPEQKPVQLHSTLLAFNGGVKGNTTTIFVHAFLSTPVTTAVVTKVEITKEHKGPYGTHSVATIPKIASYAGSVTHFTLTFQKRLFPYKGHKHGYLLAKCATGRFLAQAETIFHDGTKIGPARIVRPCTPKG